LINTEFTFQPNDGRCGEPGKIPEQSPVAGLTQPQVSLRQIRVGKQIRAGQQICVGKTVGTRPGSAAFNDRTIIRGEPFFGKTPNKQRATVHSVPPQDDFR
jgi:hypothetical protein